MRHTSLWRESDQMAASCSDDCIGRKLAVTKCCLPCLYYSNLEIFMLYHWYWALFIHKYSYIYIYVNMHLNLPIKKWSIYCSYCLTHLANPFSCLLISLINSKAVFKKGIMGWGSVKNFSTTIMQVCIKDHLHTLIKAW